MQYLDSKNLFHLSFQQQGSNNMMANSLAMADNALGMTSSNNNDSVAGGKSPMPGGSLIVANDLDKQQISKLLQSTVAT